MNSSMKEDQSVVVHTQRRYKLKKSENLKAHHDKQNITVSPRQITKPHKTLPVLSIQRQKITVFSQRRQEETSQASQLHSSIKCIQNSEHHEIPQNNYNQEGARVDEQVIQEDENQPNSKQESKEFVPSNFIGSSSLQKQHPENENYLEMILAQKQEDRQESYIQQAEQLLKTDKLSYQQISEILKYCLKINPKSDRTKWTIAALLQRSIQQKRQSDLVAIFKKQREIPLWIQSQGHIRTFENRFNSYFRSQNYSSPSDLEKFLEILNNFQSNDYSYMFRLQHKLEYMVDRILKSWEAYKPIFQSNFQRFLDLLKIKIEFVSQSRLIYPILYKIKYRLQAALDYKGARRNIKHIDDHLTDLLFQHYMQELQTRSTRPGVYYVRDTSRNDQRISLSEFIANCKQFFSKNSSWKEIFAIIAQFLQQRDSSYNPRTFEANKLFVSNLPNSSLPYPSCLGCSPYFYMNRNIYSHQVCQSLLVIACPTSQISSNVTTIKDEICALLNGKGGVLLFDCSKIYNKVIPRGSFLIENQKIQIQQKITDYLDGIYPKPQINTNIFISWIPIVQDPFQIKTNNPNIRSTLNFIEGLFTLRVTVKPTFGHITYFLNQQQRPYFSLRTQSLFQTGKRQISGRGISKLMKQKFNSFSYELKDLDEIQLLVVEKAVCSMNHTCKKPNTGIPIFERRVAINEITANPQQVYRYASVMVARLQDHESIKLNLRRFHIQGIIKAPFIQLRLRGAANSAIFYHNARFEELLSVVTANREFQYNNRKLLVISITDYVKLTERNQRNIMSQADFNSLGVWLHKKYSHESLKMWKFITDENDQQFYIQTGSKESSLYIYIVMTQFLEKSSFKNPKGLERMSEQERAARFVQYYITP